ncbi:MAG: hypothetical protein NZ742_10265, partial [Acidobacteria bacterium]|nr:hypothetical protein [Acidobacteriota bacterium]MDW7985121.1 hypothetical protein [Acidobacteriota bacterium]
MRHRWIYGTLIASLLASSIGWSQQAQKSPPNPPVPSTPPVETVGVHDPNFHYEEGRDPFENLTLRVKDKGRPREIRSVADLLVEEVSVMGIFQ